MRDLTTDRYPTTLGPTEELLKLEEDELYPKRGERRIARRVGKRQEEDARACVAYTSKRDCACEVLLLREAEVVSIRKDREAKD